MNMETLIVPEVNLAFDAAVKFIDEHPGSEITVFTFQGLPSMQQADLMGDRLVQAMACACGVPTNTIMETAFKRLVYHAEVYMKREIARPADYRSLAGTGHFVIGAMQAP